MRALLLAGLFLFEPAWADDTSEQLTAKLRQAFSRLQNGIPSTADKTAVDEVGRSAYVQLELLRQGLKEEMPKISGQCHRFLTLSDQLTTDLQSSINSFSARPDVPITSDADFELANRLQIGGASFSTLETLMTAGAEGGFEVLIPSARSTCPFQQRENIKILFHATMLRLNAFFRAAFGVPGLREMYETQERLLRMSLSDEINNRNKFWAIMAVGTVASVAVWEYAPPMAAAAIQRLWGYTPRLITSQVFTYGARASALTAEAAVFSYAGNLATDPVPPGTLLGSWEEAMTNIQFLVDSPVHAPEVELNYLSQAHAAVFASTSKWLHLLPNSKPSVQMIELLQLVAGASVSEQLRRLPKWLATNFNARPECRQFLNWGVSDRKCLIGMRKLAKGFIFESVTRPPEMMVIRLSRPDEWKRLDTDSSRPTLDVPYDADASRIHRFIAAELLRPEYRQRLGYLNQIDALKGRLEEQTGAIFEIEDRISNLNAVAGLYNLTLLAQENPALFQGRSDVIKISDHFQLPYEERLKLKEDVDAQADLGRLREYLSDVQRRSRPTMDDPHWPDRFFVVRQQLSDVTKQVSLQTGVPEVVCSDVGGLRQADCLVAIARIRQFALREEIPFPKIDLIAVVDRYSMVDPTDFYVDGRRTVLLVRSDITPRDFWQFLRGHQWLQISSGDEK